MINFLNQLFDVLKLYVDFLFDLEFLPSVSFGSLLLLVSLLGSIVTAFWVRR